MSDLTMTDRQPVLADNSGGSVAAAIAAGVGVFVLAIPIQLASIAGAGDVLTNFTPGFRGRILDVDFAVSVAVSTASRAATLNLEIGSTNLIGGTVALTSAACTPLGAVIQGAAITGNNVFTATDTISVEAASVTAFAEGAGYLLVRMQNLDTADAFASLRDLLSNNGMIAAA